MASCFKCDLLVKEGDKYVSCDGCTQKFHYSCSNLTTSELRVIELKTKRSLKFLCDVCQEGLRLIPIIKKRMDTLEDRFRRLEDELTTYKAAATGDSASNGGLPLLNNRSDEIMSEVFERQKRANNVMIFNYGLTESEQEAAHLSNFLTDLCAQPVSVTKVMRLGKPNRNGHKPLKVVLTCPQEVSHILLNKSKLRSTHRIYVEADLSPLQRYELSQVREELRTRRANGEMGLVLKYVQGRPTIVKKN